MTFYVFSKDGCPSCAKVQQLLQLAEVKHVIYKVNRDFTREEFSQNFGEGATYPRVVLEGQILGGCQETVKYLREQKLV
tara:strand:- start:293 stop:529 length:237 start_codon:yes stop_codon:yes gene_type:complete